jgi:hypothetical protein
MNIILEGIDKIGKTTWAQRLVAKYGLAYFKPPLSNEPYSNFYERHRYIYQTALDLDLTVHDRSLISEYAYNAAREISMLDDLGVQRADPPLIIIYAASNQFLEGELHDFRNEVPGVFWETDERAREYARLVNDRYKQAYLYFSELEYARVYFLTVDDREKTWKETLERVELYFS